MSWKTVEEMQEMLRGILGDAFPPPFSPRPLNEAYLRVNGHQVPKIVAEFLSQFDSPRLRPSGQQDILVWEIVLDIEALNRSGRMVADLERIYLEPVRQAGAAVIDLPAEQRRIMYPISIPLIRDLLVEVGFGIDDYINPIDGEPLAPDLNSADKIKQRLDKALAIFDEMTAERPMTVTRVHRTSIWLNTRDGPPPREWADKWAGRMWDYFLENKSEATFVPGFIPGDSLTKKEFLRLARKFGHFMLGGY